MPDLVPGNFSATDTPPPPGALAQTALNTPPVGPTAALRSLDATESREMAPAQSALDKALNEPRPAAPTPAKVPEAPKQDYSKAAQGFISSSLLLAGLASAFSRNHITTGLNAFAAANKGFHQGQIEAGETAYKEWKQSSDQVIANNNQMLDEYKAALEDRKATIAEQSQRIAAIASKYKDKFTYEAALMNNQLMYAQLYEQQRQHTQTFDQNAKRIAQEHDDFLTGLREKLAEKGMTVDESGKIVPDPALSAAGSIDQGTLRTMAEQYLMGDRTVLQNIGRGAQGSKNITALREMIGSVAKERGMTGADIALKTAEFGGLMAGERTLGTRTANVEMAVTEAQKLVPIALAASEKVNRSQYPSLNKVLLAGERGAGDPDVVRLGIAFNSIINVYARAISPTGVPTVNDKEHARELLDQSWSKGQVKAGLDQLMIELNAARQAPGAVKQEFRGQYGSGGGQGGGSNVIKYDAEGNRIE